MNLDIVRKVSFRQMVKITFVEKLNVMVTEDNYICAQWICIYCKHRAWIGKRYKDIPEDLHSYFVSPQDFDRYYKVCEELWGAR